jgi:hypothetical protein
MHDYSRDTGQGLIISDAHHGNQVQAVVAGTNS